MSLIIGCHFFMLEMLPLENKLYVCIYVCASVFDAYVCVCDQGDDRGAASWGQGLLKMHREKLLYDELDQTRYAQSAHATHELTLLTNLRYSHYSTHFYMMS